MTVISVIVGSTRQAVFRNRRSGFFNQSQQSPAASTRDCWVLRDFPMPFFDQPCDRDAGSPALRE